MKKNYTALFLVFSFCCLFAQQQTSHWYFGNWAGLSFTNSPAAPVAMTNGTLLSSEGSASISDANGNLLFYTDGITVYNKNHVVMSNGTGLCNDPVKSSTQAALIVPQPSSPNLYYVFTTSSQAGFFGGYGGVVYSIVDMSLSGGDGAVTTKNSPLLASTAEKLTAVHHSNGTDVWVMTQQWGTNAKHAWLVTSTGLSPTPVISTIGKAHNYTMNSNSGAQGYMKFSPDGKRLASGITARDTLEVFDFNSTTGAVTNLITLTGLAYGIEFSPDGTKLYSTGWSSHLLQWNLALGSQALINNSKTIIHQTPSGPTMKTMLGLQLGRDCRIYVAKYISDTIGVIQNPNLPGSLCGYNDNGVLLQGKKSTAGLPNFIQSYFKSCAADVNVSLASGSAFHAALVYPNPFSSQITVSGGDRGLQQASFAIRNLLGETVLEIRQTSSRAEETIDVSALPKGVYFLEMSSGTDQLIKKIMKE